MSFQSIIDLILANKETAIVMFIVGMIIISALRKVKKLIRVVLACVLLLSSLSFSGLSRKTIERGIESGIGFGRNVLASAEDFIPHVWHKIESLWAKNEADASSKTNATTNTIGTAAVHFLDVGQADCILVENGDDTVLIDCGNYGDAQTVTSYLDGLGITQIDYFVTTRPHEDHIGCAATILRLYDVETLLKTQEESDTACYSAMMEQAAKSGTQIEYVQAGQTYFLSDSLFQIFGPVYIDGKAPNNNSIVLRYDYQSTSFLFAGDAEREEELAILEAGSKLDADVLKIGHHGSSSSTTYPWLLEIMPQYAIIMCGDGNEYGHPHEETMSKLRDADAETYRTDLNGTIVFVSDGTAMQIYTEKSA